METEKRIIGRCPLCGGNVVKTCKGYRCEHNIGEQPSCVLNINGIIGNRKMNDAEITELLEKRHVLLDGFTSKEGKAVCPAAPASSPPRPLATSSVLPSASAGSMSKCSHEAYPNVLSALQ